MGKELAAVLQSVQVSEATLDRQRMQPGGLQREEVYSLKNLENERKWAIEIAAAIGRESFRRSC